MMYLNLLKVLCFLPIPEEKSVLSHAQKGLSFPEKAGFLPKSDSPISGGMR